MFLSIQVNDTAVTCHKIFHKLFIFKKLLLQNICAIRCAKVYSNLWLPSTLTKKSTILPLIVRVQFDHAIGADAMTENGLGMVTDVGLYRMPVPIIISYFFAVGADG